MKKEIFVLAMVLVLLGVTGCTQQSATPSRMHPFLGGSVGVAVDFSIDQPPAEVDDGGDFPFDVVVELHNLGEFDVNAEDVEVRLLGIKPEEFSKNPSDMIQKSPEDIMATKKTPEGEIIEGAPVFVEFTGFNHESALLGNREYKLRAELCYLYETKATAELCVRKNNINPEAGGVCQVSGPKTIYNSGGPVQVTSFTEVTRAKDKVGFNFAVEHVNTGHVHEQGTNCNTDRTHEEKVWIEVTTDFDSGLACTGLSGGDSTSGYVKLYSGRRTVSCTQQIDSLSDYVTSANINLVYDYRDSVETTLLVKHIPEDYE